MSVRFKQFLLRVGKECEFKPIENKLLLFLKKESERKKKNYPKLFEAMREHWPKYAEGFKISYLLKNHYREFFNFYLSTLFPFRKSDLTYDDPEAPTPVDFKLVFSYQYNEKEIEALKEVLHELNLDVSVESISKRLFIFTISSYGYMVEQIFKRPFAFQFFSIDGEKINNNSYKVTAIISGREQ